MFSPTISTIRAMISKGRSGDIVDTVNVAVTVNVERRRCDVEKMNELQIPLFEEISSGKCNVDVVESLCACVTCDTGKPLGPVKINYSHPPANDTPNM